MVGNALVEAVREANKGEGKGGCKRHAKGKTKGKARGNGRCKQVGWRDLMGPTRDAARTLVRRGLLVVTQRAKEVGAGEAWRGPCRLRLKDGVARESLSPQAAKVRGCDTTASENQA